MPTARMLTKLVVCLAVASCPVITAADTPVANPVSGDVPGSDIEQLVATSGTTSRMHSLLISRGGEVVFERYFNGYGPDDLDNVKSVSKSILSALVGIAIAAGYIDGVDARLQQYFGDELSTVAEPQAASISIEHLLTMQAGLEPTSNRTYGRWVLSDDWIRTALSRPMAATPGREMLYSTGNTHLLSAIIERTTGRTTLEFARETLAEPLGFDLARWPQDPQGVYFGGNDMVLTPRQLLMFGELYLNGGRIGDRQVVPEPWVEASLTPHAKSPHGNGRYYGYGWWVANLAGHAAPHAWGHGGQFIMLVPDLDLALVTTSASDADAGSHDHANNVYGLLQRLIRTLDDHSKPRHRYTSSRPAPSFH